MMKNFQIQNSKNQNITTSLSTLWGGVFYYKNIFTLDKSLFNV